MTPFQVVAIAVFLCVVVVAYGSEIKQKLKPLFAALKPSAKPAPQPQPTSVDLVHDMVTVAELRDRLTSIECNDGVEACTVLLRVMVEFKPDRGEA